MSNLFMSLHTLIYTTKNKTQTSFRRAGNWFGWFSNATNIL